MKIRSGMTEPRQPIPVALPKPHHALGMVAVLALILLVALLTFRVSAADAVELIGDGTHERVVVTLERFDQRVQKKAAQIP